MAVSVVNGFANAGAATAEDVGGAVTEDIGEAPVEELAGAPMDVAAAAAVAGGVTVTIVVPDGGAFRAARRACATARDSCAS